MSVKFIGESTSPLREGIVDFVYEGDIVVRIVVNGGDSSSKDHSIRIKQVGDDSKRMCHVDSLDRLGLMVDCATDSLIRYFDTRGRPHKVDFASDIKVDITDIAGRNFKTQMSDFGYDLIETKLIGSRNYNRFVFARRR